MNPNQIDNQAQTTRNERPASAPADADKAKQDALRRRLETNSANGRLAGLGNGMVGILGIEADQVDMSTVEAPQRLLQAVATALALGRCSATVAATMVKLVQAAQEAANERLEEQLGRALDLLDTRNAEIEALRNRR